jgi:D-beta-D-heptose 7-phosphate kinase/D-beta-D-heptose 1-phosphate adenosyltransferase
MSYYFLSKFKNMAQDKFDMSYKVIKDYKKLSEIINAYKILGKKVVCTIGSWDMLHIGHLRYLHKAKSEGDILIVGADSDRAIKLYKNNPLRPVIPEDERMEMLSYQNFVDYVTLIDDVDDKGAWQMNLLKMAHPDVFVAVRESYPPNQIKEIQKHVKTMKLLKRQADKTSTTLIIERTFKKRLEYVLSNAKL